MNFPATTPCAANAVTQGVFNFNKALLVFSFLNLCLKNLNL